MINLLPWREKILFRKKCWAITYVSMGYVLVLFVASVIFVKLHHEKNELTNHIKQLTYARKQQARTNYQQSIQNASEQETSAVKALVWKRYQFIKKIVLLTAAIPNAATLTQMSCTETTCDINLNINNPDIFKTLFLKYQIQDIKPGDCSLCYRARIIAIL